MRSRFGFALAIGTALFLAGCGSSKTAGDNGDGPSRSAAAGEGPADAVHRFLTAVKAGDDANASAMLTPVARQKTAEYEMVVAPPGSDTASFEIGEMEMIGDEGAHVASFWTDIDDEGQKSTDTLIWMVRKTDQGWRIAGMATKLQPDQPAVVLNFEEPEEMLARQQAIEEEMSRDTSGPPQDERTADRRDENKLRPARSQ